MTASQVVAKTLPPDRATIQRHTLRLLFGTQIVGGVGTTIGVTVGSLLAANLGGIKVAGLAQSGYVVGAALLAVPVSRLMRARGRRPGLTMAYLVGAVGAVLVVIATSQRSLPLFLAGMAAFGGGSAANLQARYAGADLALPHRRARDLSLVVWATTIGAVGAPNLVTLANALGLRLHLPSLAGPFLFSAAAFLVTSLVITLRLRPDPLLTAGRLAAQAESAGQLDLVGPAESAGPTNLAGQPDLAGPAELEATTSAPVPAPRQATAFGSVGIGGALRIVLAAPSARLGLAAVAIGHLVMIAVMSMTPVHIGQFEHGDVLRIVGLVLSVHIAGMYAAAPLVGIAADRLGRRRVILAGLICLLLACAIAGTSGHDPVRLGAGLMLLGLGWSATMVAGSALITEVTPMAARPSVQGLSDLVMGLTGASAGAVSGVVVSAAGYPTLALLAAVATVPLLGLALRPLAQAARASG
jgi:MFS family permease